jgi:hypothetical protein
MGITKTYVASERDFPEVLLGGVHQDGAATSRF